MSCGYSFFLLLISIGSFSEVELTGSIDVVDWDSGRGGYVDSSNTVSTQRFVHIFFMDSSAVPWVGLILPFVSLTNSNIYMLTFGVYLFKRWFLFT